MLPVADLRILISGYARPVFVYYIAPTAYDPNAVPDRAPATANAWQRFLYRFDPNAVYNQRSGEILRSEQLCAVGEPLPKFARLHLFVANRGSNAVEPDMYTLNCITNEL